MRRLVLPVVPVVIFVGLPLLGLSDTVISSHYTGTPENEAAGSIGKAGNASASATITIATYAGDGE